MRRPLLPFLALLLLGCGDAGPRHDDVAVHVGFVTLDERAGSPVVVLEESEGARRLPIWIGVSEARSIAAEMEEVQPPRPNTHDLAKRLIEGLDAQVERVVVTELRSGIYYARIVLRVGGRLVEIDSRPSDAIAIALRVKAPLFAKEELLEPLRDGGGEPAAGEGQQIRFRPPASSTPATPGASRAALRRNARPDVAARASSVPTRPARTC